MTHLHQPFFNFTVNTTRPATPARLDTILEQRLKVYQRARRVRRFTLNR
ncbi:MAG: hypothetical protein WAR37_01395 [Candidatus Microsaccharimonas sp.]